MPGSRSGNEIQRSAFLGRYRFHAIAMPARVSTIEIAINTCVEGPASPSTTCPTTGSRKVARRPSGVNASHAPANNAPIASTTSGARISGEASWARPSYRWSPMNAVKYSRAMYQADTSAPSDPRTYAQTSPSWLASSRIASFVKKPLNGGRPDRARAPAANSAAVHGMSRRRPPRRRTSISSWSPCITFPDVRNSRAL